MPPTKKIAPPKAVLKAYWPYTKRHPWLFGAVLASGLILQLVGLLSPWYLRQFFNTLAIAHPSAAAATALLSTLAIVAALWVFDRVLRRVNDLSNIYLQAGIMAELYEDAFDYLLGHSYNFFISNFAGSLTHKIGRYARAFETIADNVLIQFYPAALFIVGAVAVLFLRNHWLGLGLGVWCVLFVWFQVYIARKRQPVRAARSEADTKVTATLADAIANQSTIALFSGTSFESARLKEVVQDWRRKTMTAWVFDGWMWFGIGIFVVAIQVGLLWGAIVLWRAGELTLGDFVLIQSYLLTVFNQLMTIGFQLRRFYDAFADAGEMLSIMQTPHDIADAPSAPALTVTRGEVSFDRVGFFFQKTAPVFHDLSLRIPGAQKVALVGPSGAGKSTITKLLLRLYSVPEGSISIDGQNIAEVTQDSLRQAIAFVPQEPILFHRSLMDNIRYGRRDASDQEVIEAARQAHCSEFIDRLPQKYDTFVGERGIRLSGGERQRIAIARAILKDAPILVLDEATSALDSESEALIQDALSNLMRGKTVLVIAHRLSTIMKMDRIIVIEGGRIVADGTHDELLKQGGLYHKLWSIQAGGFIQDDLEPATAELATESEES